MADTAKVLNFSSFIVQSQESPSKVYQVTETKYIISSFRSNNHHRGKQYVVKLVLRNETGAALGKVEKELLF